ncbi:MAG TPA: tetratricopeptide repeat protein, partial [Rhodocyclaceae bacterium]|nr:tetratricopeptide repeat protein [Rhodocyclaceae bacterium]
MPRQRFSLLLLLVLSGCGPSVPVKPVDLIGQVSAPAALPVTRPVIAVERADDALVVAIGLLKAGDFRQAEANLEEIVKVRPDLVEAYFNLGWARFQLKKCRDAIPALQEGLKQRPAEIAAVNLIAICQRTLGLFAEAEKTYQQGLLLAPDN